MFSGQGVVIEKSPYSHYVFMDALVNAGWMTRACEFLINWVQRDNLWVADFGVPFKLAATQMKSSSTSSPSFWGQISSSTLTPRQKWWVMEYRLLLSNEWSLKMPFLYLFLRPRRTSRLAATSATSTLPCGPTSSSSSTSPTPWRGTTSRRSSKKINCEIFFHNQPKNEYRKRVYVYMTLGQFTRL